MGSERVPVIVTHVDAPDAVRVTVGEHIALDDGRVVVVLSSTPSLRGLDRCLYLPVRDDGWRWKLPNQT